ncbi:Cytosol aminopeptidase PepA [Candidatus Phaeomarinobacter ectocarpi]|uniref:Probable cytosol aminopeptidase n=1 Tax=Candidatus Phaeomarinibacter ectocarpi TaxID=1458461 RepID=X5MEE9_9HYPH|nr:leucyl aminopeptidase [Candidatus Phaeomarinobacter ectocarpi]CDO60887.1 Cytosol aminopeptidase PepA [Candidatus Phaeomarinobacter ectocarpi]
MNVTISSSTLPKTGALVLISVEGTKLLPTAQAVDEAMDGGLSKAIKAAEFKGKVGQVLDIAAPQGISVNRLFVVGLGAAKSLKPAGLETAAGRMVGRLNGARIKQGSIAGDAIEGSEIADGDVAAHLALGAQLASYRFDGYRTKQKPDQKPSLTKVGVMTRAQARAKKAWADLSAVGQGVYLARDLVNEPPNVLYPESFAKKCKALTSKGLKVEVLGEKQMEKLGMGSLLGVGQGSVRESQLVVMRWDGGTAKSKPVAFVGKGVTFDTGGISLKPGAGMEDMKGDMGGAAAVTGTMLALAARKAKVNAVGVIGLVENMPDAGAQRPGDIVTSMSGQTIEIQNTDAEGRLVLADALWYTQDRFKPRFMIDLATLTGAILVALGEEHAGLFSDNDKLADQILDAGKASGETLWRLPMGPAYDKLIKSKFADMRNIGGRFAGSITAAQFLGHYTNGVPWAHLDIAGTAWQSGSKPTSPSWGTGWGVRLLDRLVSDNFEK